MHALVAHHQLGASDDHLRKVARTFSWLEPARQKTEDVAQDTWKDFLGERTNFIGLAEFFDRELHRFDDNATQLVRAYLPDLIEGISGALLHGIIHLGYALRSPSPQSVPDALAYMAYSYQSLGDFEAELHSEVKMDPQDAFEQVLSMLYSVRQENLDSPKERLPFDARSQLLSGSQADKDRYCQRLKDYARRMSTISQASTARLDELSRTITDAVLYVYAGTGDNFFLLHAATAGWALHECLWKCGKIDSQLFRRALYAYVMAVTSIYWTQGVPEIKENVFIGREVVGEMTADWDEIKRVALASTDEHQTKLIFSCYDYEQRYGRSGSRLSYRALAAWKAGLLPVHNKRS